MILKIRTNFKNQINHITTIRINIGLNSYYKLLQSNIIFVVLKISYLNEKLLKIIIRVILGTIIFF